VDDINKWVKSHTGKLIDKIVDQIGPNTVMYLINTLYFEADWQEQYEKYQVINGNFKLAQGKTVPVEFMNSFENSYLKDDMAQGFMKPYKGNKFSFVAMLPNEGMSVDSYAASLTGEKFLSLIKNKVDEPVQVSIPEFKSEYSKSLVEPLKALGLKDCFGWSSANFSKMANNDLRVSEVMHKTFIQVDTLGTRAGAATEVEIQTKGTEIPKYKVILDRPFVYAIIDNETSLPIFIGTMHNPK
jgi:serpin B